MGNNANFLSNMNVCHWKELDLDNQAGSRDS